VTLPTHAARLSLTVGLFVAIVASSCDALGQLVPCVEHRHASGIAVVCREDIEPWKTASEELKGAVSFAFELAEVNPDGFGYPTLDFAKNEVVLRIVRPEAEPIARAWMSSGLEVPTSKQPRVLPRPSVPVRFEAATRSFAQLARIQHDVGPNLVGLPDANLIFQSGPDRLRNATRFTMERESDVLLRALAHRYGTDALVVEIGLNPHLRLVGDP
jgi:hypothetical protein